MRLPRPTAGLLQLWANLTSHPSTRHDRVKAVRFIIEALLVLPCQFCDGVEYIFAKAGLVFPQIRIRVPSVVWNGTTNGQLLVQRFHIAVEPQLALPFTLRLFGSGLLLARRCSAWTSTPSGKLLSQHCRGLFHKRLFGYGADIERNDG